jgi:hypothetical protein
MGWRGLKNHMQTIFVVAFVETFPSKILTLPYGIISSAWNI